MTAWTASLILGRHFGRSVLRHGDDWLVTWPDGESYVYSGRRLVKFAESLASNRWGPIESKKFRVGPVGLGCTCCTRMPPNELRKAARRAQRAADKRNLQKTIDEIFDF